jgi:hypothetical protein
VNTFAIGKEKDTTQSEGSSEKGEGTALTPSYGDLPMVNSSHMVTPKAQTSDGSPNLFVVMESGGIHFTVGLEQAARGRGGEELWRFTVDWPLA